MSHTATIVEIAGALSVSRQAARVRAVKEAWPHREEDHPGKKRRQYHLSTLPKPVRDAVMAKRLAAAVPTVQREASVNPVAPVPSQENALAQAMDGRVTETTERQRIERDARLLVEKAVYGMMDQAKCSKQAAMTTLLTNARAGKLAQNIDHALRTARDPRGRNGDGYPSLVSLARYLNKQDKTPKKRAKDFSIKPWYARAVELRQRPQGNSITSIAEVLISEGFKVNYHKVYRFFQDKFSQLDQLKGRYTGSKLREHRFYQHRTAEGLAPSDEVHGDGWNTHFTAPHPRTGEFVTYEVWHFHDAATRFVTPPGIGLSETFEVVSKGLENYVRAFGRPNHVQVDSTKVVKGSDRFNRLEDRIGCTITHPVEVGNSQANGICENFNVTWLDKQSRHLATYQAKGMDTLTFRNVKKHTAAMVKAFNAGDLEGAEKLHAAAEKTGKGRVFKSYLEAVEWINAIVAAYNDRPHSSLKKVRDEGGKLRHQTPREALIEHIVNGWEPYEVEEDTLVDIFRPHKELTVTRETVSPYGGMRYRNPDVLGHWNGKRVVVAFDLFDWTAQVWVKTLRGELICMADFVEATGYRAQSAYEAGEEKRAKAQLLALENKKKNIQRERLNGATIEAPSDGLISVHNVIDIAPTTTPEREGTYEDTVHMLWGEDKDSEEGDKPTMEAAWR